MIKLAVSTEEVIGCFDVISALRPHLSLDEYVARVERMNTQSGYQLAYLDDNGIKSVAGFRISEWLPAGKYLEIEDLITIDGERSKGYGGKLFDWVLEHARENECNQLRLVSGVFREDAHRFYINKGMTFEAKFFSIMLKESN